MTYQREPKWLLEGMEMIDSNSPESLLREEERQQRFFDSYIEELRRYRILKLLSMERQINAMMAKELGRRIALDRQPCSFISQKSL